MSMIGSTWGEDVASSYAGMKGSPRREAMGKVVDELIRDLKGRSGLRHVWDGIDSDIRDEIRETWIDIVAKARGVL